VVAALDLRLRVTSPELLGLPWRDPLSAWDPTAVSFRDIPVGPSRHLVRFVEADGALWALKSLPQRLAQREYDVLRQMEIRALSAVRVAGVVIQPVEDEALLVTHYLERSWQYRRLLMRIPTAMGVHRGRLFDAMALLLVDLHRNGIYWGDCSLANTLFMRDGQTIQAWMVDAETAAFHPTLSDGQRQMDLEIMTENVAGGLLDVAARREEPPEAYDGIIDEAHSVARRYTDIWSFLHDEPVVGYGDRRAIGSRLRDLNDLGFSLDEVRLEPEGDASESLRMKVAVAGRTFHSERLRSLTGLSVGEGQATILMNDLRSYHSWLQREQGVDVPEERAALRWLTDVFVPMSERAFEAGGRVGDPTQAYCDFLEIRWLLSEQAGHDVGDEATSQALADHVIPDDSAATISFVETPTAELPEVDAELLDDSETSAGPRAGRPPRPGRS